jgi:hypothetical protein
LHLLHLASDVLLCHLHCLLLGGLSLDFLLLEYTEEMLPPLLEALLPLLLCQLLGHLGSLLLLLLLLLLHLWQLLWQPLCQPGCKSRRDSSSCCHCKWRYVLPLFLPFTCHRTELASQHHAAPPPLL